MASTLTAASPSTARPQTLRAAVPAVVALCLTMLVEMVDNSVLNVALPTIGRDLHAGPTDLQWIVGAYSLTFGGLLMVGGTLGDRLGRKRALLWGLVGFAVAGALVLFVHTTTQLIAIRALSGAFAALVTPGTMSLTFRLFEDAKLRAKAIGVIVTVGMAGFALGPVVAGIVITHLPWQVLLVANAPVAALAYLGVRQGIPDDDPGDLRSGSTDLAGAALSVLALGLGLYSFTLGAEHGWLAAPTILCALAAIAAGFGFVGRERTASDPMLDLRLLSRPTVRGSALIQVSVSIAAVGVLFAATQLFQYAWGWSPVLAGLANLPIVVGMLAATPLVDHIIQRAGHRVAAIAGTSMILVGLVICLAALGHGYAPFAIGMILLAGGMRLAMTSCAIELIDALPSDHTSIGSAMNDTAQEVGNAIGVAIIGTITAAVIGAHLPTTAWSAALTAGYLHGLRIAFGLIAAVVAVIAVIGVRSLGDSTTLEEH